MLFYVRNPFLGRIAQAVVLDLACFVLAALAAWAATPPEIPFATFAAATALAGIGVFLTLQATGAYDLTSIGNGRRTFNAVLTAMGLGLAAALLIYFVVPLPAGSQAVLSRCAAIFFPALLAERAAFRALSKRSRKRLLILGASDLAFALAAAIDSRKGLGIEVAGLLSDDPEHQRSRDINSYSK